MINISILSIYSQNYGNRLQAYAMCTLLKEERFGAVHSLWVPMPDRDTLVKRAIHKSKNTMIGIANNIFGRNVRNELFQSFTDCLIPTEKTSPINPLSEREGVFVIGSDQCWNPSWGIGSREDGSQCAAGVPANRKLAYAASFGISYDSLSPDWRKRYSCWLSEFAPDTISMREDAGAAIVKELTGRDVPVVLDPTMLLSTDDWEAIEHRPRINAFDLEKPFCLKYVLGDDVNGECIDSMAAERGLSVVDLRDKSLPVGPAEFVWLIHHSDLVCTDSFHASVFSILFHRPFVIYERQEKGACDMSCRFDTLVRLSGLSDHRFNKTEFNWDSVWDCDWDTVDIMLSAERVRSLTWLREALKKAGEMLD